MGFFSKNVTLFNLFIIKNYILSTHSYTMSTKKKKCKRCFIVIYISCEWFILLKTDLSATNKNHIIAFLKKVKNKIKKYHGKDF